MNGYLNEIRKRHITRLCHFTKSSNLPFILGDGRFERNGILSTAQIRQSSYLEELDKKRLDGHLDYVCCSVQHPNDRYFKSRQWQERSDLFNQWAVLYIDPSVIGDTSLFSPVNAATARGANIHGGLSAFQALFASPVHYLRRGHDNIEERDPSLPNNYPTDPQAEVMIKDKIPVEQIIGVAFPARTFEVEKQRLEFCLDDININIEKLEDN
ncbi:DarT ssDNA thymidine ADP-ribosyltransferase family protein [Limosilactobacillus sp.]|uniref:DarT ssDNA thymidine ADP-ribosyltransferase family protein n=1 Tax=Limosilactobacillus sp. TaxID=2773925 RepID=UPI0035A00EBF